MVTEKEKQVKWENRNYMLHENELWLNEQAEKGLLLKRFNKHYASFTETAPENIKYKIVVLSEKKVENQVKIIEHQGFAFVGNYDEYYIFYIDGKYGHIEPRLNEEMLGFARKWFNKHMIKIFAEALICIPLIALNIGLDWNNLFETIVGLSLIWYAIWGVVFTTMMINGIREYTAVNRTKKCFLSHEEYLSDRNPRKATIMRIFIIGICILGTISPIKYACFEPDQYSIADLQKVMPVVLLQDIEEDNELSEVLKVSQSTINQQNYAEIKHTLMAPKQYYASQGNNRNSIMIYYYEVTIEKLAEPLAKELSTKMFLHIKKEWIKKVDVDGLDAAYIYRYKDGGITTVSACKGKRVMYIWYNNEGAPVDNILREMVEVL